MVFILFFIVGGIIGAYLLTKILLYYSPDWRISCRWTGLNSENPTIRVELDHGFYKKELEIIYIDGQFFVWPDLEPLDQIFLINNLRASLKNELILRAYRNKNET